MHCGIAPGGTMAGCDLIPVNSAPAGTNQTIVDGSSPAHYIHSDTTTFNRDVEVLPRATDSRTGQPFVG